MISNPVFIKELKNKLDNYPHDNQNCGIVLGDAGMILSLSELYTYTKNEYYLDKMYEIFDTLLEQDNYDLSLGYGISGLAWCLSLIDEELIENRNEWLMDIQSVLEIEYESMLEQGNLDYYRGATGLIFYFLNTSIKLGSIKKIIDLYLETVQIKLSKNDWFEPAYENSEYFGNILNFSTPHGLTGIILMLLIIKEKEIEVDEKLIDSMFEIIFEYEFEDNEINDCHFPSRVFENGRRDASGLAWCYGDLMIAYAMLKYGILYKKDDYIQHSKIILKNSLSKKITHSETLILCHGLPSLSLIYNVISKRTGEHIYNDASKLFEQKCKQVISDSYSEYKKNRVPHYFFDRSSLLIGYSGFILSSLFWDGYNGCDWKKCLLL